MRAVVLAAGLGTRMGKLTEEIPKGLLKIAGREIVYRSLKTLESLGVKEFIVITNPKYREKYEEFLKREGFKYKIVLNNHPERGNGYSLYLAKDYVDGKFALIMSDHIYEEEFLKEAIKKEGQKIFYFDKENSHKDLVALVEHFEDMNYSVYLREVKYGLDENDYMYEVHIL